MLCVDLFPLDKALSMKDVKDFLMKLQMAQ